MSKIKPYKEAAEMLQANHVDEPMLVYGAMVSNAGDYLKNGHVESLVCLPRIGMEDSYLSSSKIVAPLYYPYS